MQGALYFLIPRFIMVKRKSIACHEYNDSSRKLCANNRFLF